MLKIEKLPIAQELIKVMFPEEIIKKMNEWDGSLHNSLNLQVLDSFFLLKYDNTSVLKREETTCIKDISLFEFEPYEEKLNRCIKIRLEKGVVTANEFDMFVNIPTHMPLFIVNNKYKVWNYNHSLFFRTWLESPMKICAFEYKTIGEKFNSYYDEKENKFVPILSIKKSLNKQLINTLGKDNIIKTLNGKVELLRNSLTKARFERLAHLPVWRKLFFFNHIVGNGRGKRFDMNYHLSKKVNDLSLYERDYEEAFFNTLKYFSDGKIIKL
jgi:hypothetical protein